MYLKEVLLNLIYFRAIRLFFSLSPDSSQISVAKFDVNKQSVELTLLDIKSQSVKTTTTPISTSNWLTHSTSCSFITSTYLVCIDEKNLVLQYLTVGETKTFTGVPLSAFGLHTNSKPKYLRLQSLPYQEHSDSPYFSINLGGDGFVILRVGQRQIDLIKVLPKVLALTLAPVVDTDRIAVCTLLTKPNPTTATEESDSAPSSPETGIQISAFDIENWSEVPALSTQFVLQNDIIVEKFNIIPFLRSDYKHTYKLLFTTKDSTLILTNLRGRITWKREEALSSISSAELIDLPLSEVDAKIEQTFSFDQTNIVTQLVTRISTQIYQLQAFTKNLVNQIVATVTKKPVIQKSVDSTDDEFSDGSDSAVSKDASDVSAALVRDKFGLHKLIIALATNGKLFAIDSQTGAIVWSVYEPYLSHKTDDLKQKLPILVQRTTAHYPFPPQCAVINKNGFIFSFNPITGQVFERIKLEVGVSQTMLLSHTDSNYLKPILILDDKLKPIIYPSSAKSLFLTVKDIYYMLSTNSTDGSVKGFSFTESNENELIAKQVWALDLPLPMNGLQVVFKRYGEHVHSQGRVMGDRNVLYKYLNPNLVAIVGESIDAQEKRKISSYLVFS